MTDIEIVAKYAEAWEKLDQSIIEPYLDESFSYSSFWVFETLDRERYIDYLSGKFKAIRATNTAPIVSMLTTEGRSPSVVLKQGNKEPAAIVVKIKDGKLTEGYMLPLSFVQ